MSLAVISHIGLWLLALSQLLMVLALTRQIGLLHRRLTPDGARMMNDGPAVGEMAPQIDAIDLAGRPASLATSRHKMTLLVFVSPGCATCAEVMPGVRSIVRTERRALEAMVLSLSGDDEKNREFVARHKLKEIPFLASGDIARRYDVRQSPYAVLVGVDGRVKSKGLTNHLEHLESLLTAARLGHPTVEHYVREHGLAPSPAGAPADQAAAS